MSYDRYSQNVQTTNATPVVVYSTIIPAGSAADITVDFLALRSDYSNASYGNARAVFRRPSAGNVARATGNGGALSAALTVIGDFLVMPNVDIVANTGTQTADVRITGLAATTLNWTFSVNVKRNTL